VARRELASFRPVHLTHQAFSETGAHESIGLVLNTIEANYAHREPAEAITVQAQELQFPARKS